MYNKKLISLLKKLSDYYSEKGDEFREKAYQKAIFEINKRNKEIISKEDALTIPGIGKGISEKIDQFLKTGKIDEVEEIKKLKKMKKIKRDEKEKEKEEKEKVISLFMKIYGIGNAKANELYNLGFRNIEDLKNNISLLNNKQKIGLEYVNKLDVLKRSFIKSFEKKFKKIVGGEYKNIYIDFCGSYRRGKETSGDIDILISKVYNKEEIRLIDIVQILISSKIIKEILSYKEQKFLSIACYKGIYFRMDIEFCEDEKEYYTSLVYFTGSKNLNIILRSEAKSRGMLLNEKGLFKRKDDGEIKRINIKSEEDVFKKLGMKYLTPEERNI